MYPAHYYGLFPAFPRQKTVFVAMSFDSKFDRRWAEVLAPAVHAITINDSRLEAVRVDARVVCDSILTEILSGIGTCQVVLADITSVGYLNDRPIRNGNVMYEIGLAHAVRLPEEVLLFRSDRDALLFDTANVRVNEYNPDEQPEEARRQVKDAIAFAVREIDLRRSLAVRAVVDSLDAASSRFYCVARQREGTFIRSGRRWGKRWRRSQWRRQCSGCLVSDCLKCNSKDSRQKKLLIPETPLWGR